MTTQNIPIIRRMTPSRYGTEQTCQRLAFYKAELGYRPIRKAMPLLYGTLVHVALEAWWKAWQDGNGDNALELAKIAMDEQRPSEIDDFTYAIIKSLIVGYDVRWSPDMPGIEVLAVEAQYEGALCHPVTGHPAENWLSAGKLDAVFKFRKFPEYKFGIEHKTSSADLSTGSVYWTRLRMDPQLSAYFDGAELLGHNLDAYYYDVIAKPKIRPKLATAEIKMTLGKKCGTKKKPCQGDNCGACKGSRWKEAPRPYSGQRNEDETVEEYRERVVTAICAEPEHYYHRERIVRLDSELDAARRDYWITAMRVEQFGPPENWEAMIEVSDLHMLGAKYWLPPRNTNACASLYGSMCPFFGVCSGTDSLTNTNTFERPGPHPELEIER